MCGCAALRVALGCEPLRGRWAACGAALASRTPQYLQAVCQRRAADKTAEIRPLLPARGGRGRQNGGISTERRGLSLRDAHVCEKSGGVRTVPTRGVRHASRESVGRKPTEGASCERPSICGGVRSYIDELRTAKARSRGRRGAPQRMTFRPPRMRRPWGAVVETRRPLRS